MAEREIVVHVPSTGQDLPFRHVEGVLARNVLEAMLRGKAYPQVQGLRNVRTILDIGANVGAASLYFSQLYPEAEIWAFEPAATPFGLLSRNLAPITRVHCHNVGLHESDGVARLWHGLEDSVTGSIGASVLNGGSSEEITLRDAAAWIAEHGITRADIVKIDAEGCELPILRRLGEIVLRCRVLYVEYHSEEDRLALDQLLAGTHILCTGTATGPHRGELCYLARAAVAAEVLDRFRIGAAPPPAAAAA